MNKPLSSIPQEIAIPGFHAWMEAFILSRFGSDYTGHILDTGAGEGAFTLRLKKNGYRVSACDLFADHFKVDGVDFKQANITETIPWDDHTFDLVLALELTEHLDGVLAFFREVHRVLKPGGYFLFSTPNILSIKSRLQFLLSGYMYAFHPIDPSDPNAIVDHITPLPLDLYLYRLGQCGFTVQETTTDKRQKSSRLGMVLYPWIRLYSRLRYKNPMAVHRQNSLNTLLGRKLIVLAHKE